MLLLLQYTLIFASVLLLVALGGCFSEHSGVINIGLEGIMVMGALGGALMMKFLPAGTSAFVVVLLTVLASILLGMIYSLLLAVAAVNFKADQTLVGTAMNLLGTAAATVFVKAMNTAADPDNVSSTIQYLDGRKAFLVNIGGFEFNWCMLLAVIALVIAYVVLYKTRFGLRLCACGEHPQAADSVGINVYRMRYAGVLISGVLGGLGGIVYIIAGVSEWKFENGVAGFGFLTGFEQWQVTQSAVPAMGFNGIAAAFLGGLNPIGAIFSSYFIQHITNGGAYVDKTMYSAQISDLISALIIYLCGFVLFFKVFMNSRLDRRDEKRRAKEDRPGSEEGGKA